MDCTITHSKSHLVRFGWVCRNHHRKGTTATAAAQMMAISKGLIQPHRGDEGQKMKNFESLKSKSIIQPKGKWKFQKSKSSIQLKGCRFFGLAYLAMDEDINIFQFSIPGNGWRYIGRWRYPTSKPEIVCIKNSNSSIRKSSEDQQTITRVYCTCNGRRKWVSRIPLHDSSQARKVENKYMNK